MGLPLKHKGTQNAGHRDRDAERGTSYHYRLQPAYLCERDYRHSRYHLCPDDEPHPPRIRRTYKAP